MLHRSAKTLLQNVIRHTDTHNRIVEEAEMWRQKEKKSQLSKKDKERGDKDKEEKDKKSTDVFFEDTRKSFLYDNRVRDDSMSYRRYRAHMDDEPTPSSTTRSTYYTRQLQRAEENDPGRWGHSGYKELYPEEFRSDRSEDEENGPHHRRHKRRTRKRRKEKKRRQHYRSRSDDSGSDCEPRRKRRKTTGCSKHRKHRRSRDSSTGSETVRYIRRKLHKERRHRRHKSERLYDTSEIDIKPRLPIITSNQQSLPPPPQQQQLQSSLMGHQRRSRHNSGTTSLREQKQTRHMSCDNSDSGAESAGPKRQKFQRDYSSSDSEDSYCLS
ncbi:uncharacterized protein NKAPD1-like [Argonauta hians]